MTKESILKWWLAPKYPETHIKKPVQSVSEFLKKWIIHPVKRRVARSYLTYLQRTTDIKVIGITGSAGKTTTKEMLASILKRSGKTIWTRDNIDPIYNIPTTILKTPVGTKYLILEMGIEYPGEMDFYLWMAKPEIGIVTNIYPTHLEFLGSIEGVLEEKGKLVLNLPKNGVAVLNPGDPNLKKLSKKIKSKIILFKPNVNPLLQNADAAEVTAKYLGVSKGDISEGLKSFKPAPHRLKLIKLKNGAQILDDTYNSNPEAAISTLNYFDKIMKHGIRIAILGDMLELGEYEKEGHKKVGKVVAGMDFDYVVGVGNASRYLIDAVRKDSKKTKTYLFNNASEVIPFIKSILSKNTSMVIKGSRSIGLDRVVDAIV